MSLQAAARSALTAIKAAVPSAVVTISQASADPAAPGPQTATAIRNTGRATSGLTQFGEEGGSESTVWTSAADFAEPERGATITIAGELVTVMETRIDPAGAILAIGYRKQHPHEVPGV